MITIKKIWAYFAARLSESSTWAGMATAVAAAAGLEGNLRNAVIALGVIAMLAKHPKAEG
jgi:hypothetical protein